MIDKGRLADQFRTSAGEHFKDSALLAPLMLQIADDDELLDVARTANPDAFIPYLLLAAVHSQLLENPDCALARYFPTASHANAPAADAFPAFKAHVLDRRQSIEAMMRNARVNKTIPQRSACLRAMLVEVAGRKSWQRVHLVDIGCGAGLNLLMDQWRIAYGEAGVVGPEDSAVRMKIEVRGAPPPMGDMPEVLSRTGIDLDLMDSNDPAHQRWLLGFIQPDQPEVLELTCHALASMRRMPPRLIQGNVATQLPKVLDAIPGEDPVVVMHSMVLFLMSPAERVEVSRAMAKAAQRRPLVRLGMEVSGGVAKLIVEQPGDAAPSIVGMAERNASWINWGGEPS